MIKYINLLTGVPTHGHQIVDAPKAEDLFKNRFLYGESEIKDLEEKNVDAEEIQERVTIGRQINDMLKCVGEWPSE
jgi:hypothetical protein